MSFGALEFVHSLGVVHVHLTHSQQDDVGPLLTINGHPVKFPLNGWLWVANGLTKQQKILS